jgi:hypothetical protein
MAWIKKATGAVMRSQSSKIRQDASATDLASDRGGTGCSSTSGMPGGFGVDDEPPSGSYGEAEVDVEEGPKKLMTMEGSSSATRADSDESFVLGIDTGQESILTKCIPTVRPTHNHR